MRYVVVNQTPNYLCSDILSAIARRHPKIQLEIWHGLRHAPWFSVPETVTERIGPAYNSSTVTARAWSWLRFTYWVQRRISGHNQEDTRYLFFSNPPTLVFLKSARSLQVDYAIYDLYPDALSRLRSSCLLLPAIAVWARRTADAFLHARVVFVISAQMAAGARSYLPPETHDKVTIVPLWAERKFFQEVSHTGQVFRDEWGLGNKRVILYAGTLGASQPVTTFVAIAQQLARSPDWLLVIVGRGSHARLVERRIRSFTNVVVQPPVPHKQFGALLSIADWGLVVLSEASGNTSVPSKAYNLLAAGVPLLAMVPEASETARLVDEDRVGIRCSSQDTGRVLDAVTTMPKAERDAYSRRALETAKRYTSALAEEFVPLLPEDDDRPRGT